MQTLSLPLLAWHDAISALFTHAPLCTGCSNDGTVRCPEGQRLYDAEQVAWRAKVRAEYAGRAVRFHDVQKGGAS